ncbi:MAG: hypothetical protein IPL84_14890 [Chitinophagaceae bacterium]|nr:hypothetical protein [Chitinophagaceae bacterium]
MKNKFLPAVKSLAQVANRFDEEASSLKKNLLQTLCKLSLPHDKNILPYHELLLFLCAYPGNPPLKKLAENELQRIALFGKQIRSGKITLPENEGLPYGNTVTRFSPDFLSWLLLHKDLQVEFDSFYDPTLSLNDVLNITLPATLKAETTAGLNNEDLLEVLHIKPRQYIPFILGQLEQLKDMPLLKELFNERLDPYVKLVPKNAAFSKANNRVPAKQVYYHNDLLKHFNPVQLISEPLQKVRIPGKAECTACCNVIKNSMALTVREIDPATFLEAGTLRLYDLERGLVFAMYSMIPNRQLPLETYFGFTFFKNGIPVSYGGIWAFGKMGKIGVNIFEPYRGGESGYILCQLLRVMKQVMGIHYVEIEPFQFGLDNPDGINSGAFWFYYKFGFRPVDNTLKQLATDEYHKIKNRKNYRSSAKILLRFTESNIGINLGKKLPMNVLTVTGKILSVIKNAWHHNYHEPKIRAVEIFCKQVKLDTAGLTKTEKNVLEDIALWAMAMKITNPQQLQLMKQMVFTKTTDDYAYQQLLLDFFEA